VSERRLPRAERPRSAEPTLQPSADVPSARHPTPIAPLLKANAKPQFERPVESLSTPLFSVFQGSNRGQFRPCFLVQGVRSAEGRGRCLAADFLVFKDLSCYPPGRAFNRHFLALPPISAIKKVYFLVNSSTVPTPPHTSHLVPVWRRLVPSCLEVSTHSYPVFGGMQTFTTRLIGDSVS
jgi:hypothetical protein